MESEYRVRLAGSRKYWDESVNLFAGNPFQFWGWGEVKESTGRWWALRLLVSDKQEQLLGGAQVLIREVPFPFRNVAYVPRGPFGFPSARELVADAVTGFVKHHTNSVAITFEPAEDACIDFAPSRSVTTGSSVLLSDTLILDLQQSEDALLRDMAKKTRYYVRKSFREGIVVQRVTNSQDVETCLDIYEQTAIRADFAIHGRDYYRALFRKLGDQAPAFLAFYEGVPVAFLWLLVSEDVALELYAGATQLGLKIQANYGLKWWCITELKAAGVRKYDLNGLLDGGVSQFKKGFASHINRLHPPVEIPLSRLYPLWAKMLPAVRQAMGTLKQIARHIRTWLVF